MMLGPPLPRPRGGFEAQAREQEICTGVVSFILSAVGVLWPGPNLLEEGIAKQGGKR